MIGKHRWVVPNVTDPDRPLTGEDLVTTNGQGRYHRRKTTVQIVIDYIESK